MTYPKQDVHVKLELSQLELNFLQVAVDDLIDVQRGVIHDCANQSNDLEIVKKSKNIFGFEKLLNFQPVQKKFDKHRSKSVMPDDNQVSIYEG